MASTLNIGLMGYGFAGATFHAPVIDHCGAPDDTPAAPYARVTAIATSQPERARAAYPQAQVVAGIDALIASDEVECIVIATPNDTHYALAAKVLAAGKHVVVDKPVTLTSAEARTLARMAREHGMLFAPFHNRRWDGDFMTVRALIESGALGRVAHFESHFDRFRPQVPERWREEAARGGGLLFDLGPHLIDQALVLFGAPESIYASVKQHRDGASAPDYVHLLLAYPDKEVVLHASALCAIEPPRFSVHGTRGSYVKFGLDTQEDQLKAGLRPGQAGFGGGNAAGTIRAQEGERLVESQVPTREGEYAAFYRAVAQAVKNGDPFPVTPQDAVDVMTIIELAHESARTGTRVPFVRVPV
jgi:predicted dehydrogenase